MLGFHSSFLQNLRCKGQYMHITTCPTHPNGINDSDMKVPQFQNQVTRDTLKCNAKILMTPLCKQTHLYINITLHYRFKTGCTIIKRHVWTRLGQTAEVSANFHFIPAFLMPSLRKKSETGFDESDLDKQNWAVNRLGLHLPDPVTNVHKNELSMSRHGPEKHHPQSGLRWMHSTQSEVVWALEMQSSAARRSFQYYPLLFT